MELLFRQADNLWETDPQRLMYEDPGCIRKILVNTHCKI